MHQSSMLRMEWFARNYLEMARELKILDVGSYNVNGCYREIFESRGFTYSGLDMEHGPNVDIVPKEPYCWKEICNEAFDVVISGQTFEHIEFFWVTMTEMVRILKKGGIICIIAPNGFKEHRYPVDCWRFFSDGMVALARYTNLEILHVHTNAGPSEDAEPWHSEDEADSMLIARKPYEGATKLIDLNGYICNPSDLDMLSSPLLSNDKVLSERHQKDIEVQSDLALRRPINVEQLKNKDKTCDNRIWFRLRKLCIDAISKKTNQC